MHGVRHAVACGVHCEQCDGSLRFVVSELRQNAHASFRMWCDAVESVSASNVTRVVDRGML